MVNQGVIVISTGKVIYGPLGQPIGNTNTDPKTGKVTINIPSGSTGTTYTDGQPTTIAHNGGNSYTITDNQGKAKTVPKTFYPGSAADYARQTGSKAPPTRQAQNSGSNKPWQTYYEKSGQPFETPNVKMSYGEGYVPTRIQAPQPNQPPKLGRFNTAEVFNKKSLAARANPRGQTQSVDVKDLNRNIINQGIDYKTAKKYIDQGNDLYFKTTPNKNLIQEIGSRDYEKMGVQQKVVKLIQSGKFGSAIRDTYYKSTTGQYSSIRQQTFQVGKIKVSSGTLQDLLLLSITSGGTGALAGKVATLGPKLAKGIKIAEKGATIVWAGSVPIQIALAKDKKQAVAKIAVESVVGGLSYGIGKKQVLISALRKKGFVYDREEAAIIQKKRFGKVYTERPPTKVKLNNILRGQSNYNKNLIISSLALTLKKSSFKPFEVSRLVNIKTELANNKASISIQKTRQVEFLKNEPIVKNKILLSGAKLTKIVNIPVPFEITKGGYYAGEFEKGKLVRITALREGYSKSKLIKLIRDGKYDDLVKDRIRIASKIKTNLPARNIKVYKAGVFSPSNAKLRITNDLKLAKINPRSIPEKALLSKINKALFVDKKGNYIYISKKSTTPFVLGKVKDVAIARAIKIEQPKQITITKSKIQTNPLNKPMLPTIHATKVFTGEEVGMNYVNVNNPLVSQIGIQHGNKSIPTARIGDVNVKIIRENITGKFKIISVTRQDNKAKLQPVLSLVPGLFFPFVIDLP